MNTDRVPRDRGRLVAAVIPIVIILIPLGYSLVSHVFAEDADGAAPFVEMPSNGSERCVRGLGKDYMRFHHMDLLKEIRIDAVRDGIRGEVTFDHCWECHTSRTTFCDRCHDVVNLDPDCFDCHYYPE